ncbi:hypothetical protein ASC81_25930 [Pelomonas sp. Root405]|nr:hypothetical protein ASC81_25930 [Pelomonas sp. Root405]
MTDGRMLRLIKDGIWCIQALDGEEPFTRVVLPEDLNKIGAHLSVIVEWRLCFGLARQVHLQ